ncbi:hypothetical protein [Echinicola soli]|uniref:hypothetical protein n=1 Tax=Echinicola soli TaxID=2591634 RepID=UPI00143D5D90|nr:hypothetical protein [Echinicola soli]
MYFNRYGEATRINADLFDHTDSGDKKTYSMRLNGMGNEVYGLAKSLESLSRSVFRDETR